MGVTGSKVCGVRGYVCVDACICGRCVTAWFFSVGTCNGYTYVKVQGTGGELPGCEGSVLRGCEGVWGICAWV